MVASHRIEFDASRMDSKRTKWHELAPLMTPEQIGAMQGAHPKGKARLWGGVKARAGDTLHFMRDGVEVCAATVTVNLRKNPLLAQVVWGPDVEWDTVVAVDGLREA